MRKEYLVWREMGWQSGMYSTKIPTQRLIQTPASMVTGQRIHEGCCKAALLNAWDGPIGVACAEKCSCLWHEYHSQNYSLVTAVLWAVLYMCPSPLGPSSCWVAAAKRNIRCALPSPSVHRPHWNTRHRSTLWAAKSIQAMGSQAWGLSAPTGWTAKRQSLEAENNWAITCHITESH